MSLDSILTTILTWALSNLEYTLLIGILSVLVLDRWGLKRGMIQALDIQYHDQANGYHRFKLTFKAKPPFRFTQVYYEIRDCNCPALVLKGKDRSLDFSKKGQNQELLLINSKLFHTDTQWEASVKLTSAGSFFNPFYKIFPFQSQITKFVTINSKQEQ